LYEDGNSAHGLKTDDNEAAIAKRDWHIATIHAPPQSPNLNCIKKGWRNIKSTLKEQLMADHQRAHDVDILDKLVQERWDKIEQSWIQKEYNRWPSTLRAIRQRKGFMTP